ncbi:MAG TPA: hypothetical protein VKA84_06095, partial [Gemmatimonadaceae bacterium]|nr:hypothetical protein [Gemmatimonadaceae bacterium]
RAGRTPAAAQPAGAPAASLDDAPEAVLVFWGSVGDCRPVALPPDVLGTQPGEHVFVSGMLRARDRWVGGRPTVDVYATPHLYVPSRERDHWAGTSDSIPAGEELMTAEEYFAFYEGLPTRDDWDRHSTFARRRLRRWLRANAQLVTKEPAARMIRDMSAGRSRRY